MRNIQRVLELWGGWAARDNHGLGWSPVAAGFKGLITAPRSSRPCCCDDDGLVIDACVARLRQIRQTGEFDLVVAHYVYGASKRTLARLLKQDEKTVRVQLQVAEGFIDGCLSLLNARPEMDPEVEIEINKAPVHSRRRVAMFA